MIILSFDVLRNHEYLLGPPAELGLQEKKKQYLGFSTSKTTEAFWGPFAFCTSKTADEFYIYTGIVSVKRNLCSVAHF